MAEDELKGAKKTQRNAKSTFTRCGNWLTNIVEVKRPESEVRDALSKVEEAYNDLVVKHENYTTLIDDDAKFEEAEIWMNGCQGSFMNYVMQAKMYLDSLVSQKKQTLENNEDKEKTSSNQSSMIGISNINLKGMWFPAAVLIITTRSLLSMLYKKTCNTPLVVVTMKVSMTMFKS